MPVEVIEQRTVGATLGDAAIDASVEAAVIGIALTGLFIVVVYRLMGLMATWRSRTYALISYGCWSGSARPSPCPGWPASCSPSGWRSTPTCWSSNEPARSTPRAPGAGLAPALDTGYRKAWSAILDSNITTLLAAGLLFFFASGPVKGFGVTLSIGVIASMISALVMARVLTDWAVRTTVHYVRARPASAVRDGCAPGWSRAARS